MHLTPGAHGMKAAVGFEAYSDKGSCLEQQLPTVKTTCVQTQVLPSTAHTKAISSFSGMLSS